MSASLSDFLFLLILAAALLCLGFYVLQDDPQYAEVQIPCDEIVFEGISGDLHVKLVTLASAAGAKFEGDQVLWHGCTVLFNYDEPSQTLRVTCTRKPFYIGCDQIAQGLREEVEKAKTAI